MKRTYHTDQFPPASVNGLDEHIAFHEAGHVTAIYIRNNQQKLPPVFFQIILNKNEKKEYPFFARVEGGRLIENLPIAEIEKNHLETELERKDLIKAYEADVINLLAGPLAEAKFVALRDGEIFNPHLVNIVALKNYGGHSDLEQANQYLEYFIVDKEVRELKIKSLFEQAFQFIDNPDNWKCIKHFASYLLANGQENISCEQASETLEKFLCCSKQYGMAQAFVHQ